MYINVLEVSGRDVIDTEGKINNTYNPGAAYLLDMT